jgi:renalase
LTGTGYVAPWSPRAMIGEHGEGQVNNWFVGTPGMSALVRPLAESVRIHTNRAAHTIGNVNGAWHVWFEDETSSGPYAAVAITVPAPQAQYLLGPLDELAEPLSRVRMAPCWALMVKLDQSVLPEQDVYSDMSEVIRWVARNNTKPNRSCRGGETVVIHASQKYSRETEDMPPEEVAEELWAEVSHVLALPAVKPIYMSAYLWKHGLVDQSLGESYLFSSEHNVGIAGDWCAGRLAEHAFDSGQALGRAIVASLD